MRVCWLLALVLAVSLVGCTAETKKTGNAQGQGIQTTAAEDKVDEAAIKAALAELSPEDRRLAEQQKFCALDGESRLGSMDKPFKLMLLGEPVFLCCKGCRQEALSNPEKTVARAKELRAKNAAAAAQ
jgi:hypothetical protein